MSENLVMHNRSLNCIQIVFTESKDIKVIDIKDVNSAVVTVSNYKKELLTLANVSSLECFNAFYKLEYVANYYPEFRTIYENIMFNRTLSIKDILILSMFITIVKILDNNNTNFSDTEFKTPIIYIATNDEGGDIEIELSKLYDSKELKIPINTDTIAMCPITNCLYNKIIITAAGLALNAMVENKYL